MVTGDAIKQSRKQKYVSLSLQLFFFVLDAIYYNTREELYRVETHIITR